MKKVVTVCPYCASGCKINLVVDNGKIVRAEAAQGKTNQGTLCLKGYYGWDFINDTQILTPRLKTPMIRRQRGGKLEPVSWDEALVDVAAEDEFWLAPVEDCVLELLLPQAVTDITMMSSSIAKIAGLIFFIIAFSFRFLSLLCAFRE